LLLHPAAALAAILGQSVAGVQRLPPKARPGPRRVHHGRRNRLFFYGKSTITHIMTTRP